MENIAQFKRVIQRLVARYPNHASEIRRAALSDDTFRDMCDELAIAIVTLNGFEARADADTCPEIPEYKTLISELEAEISDYLSKLGVS